MIKVTRASHAEEVRPYVKVLLYGENGTGKTTWGANTPRPLVLLTEEQGRASITHTYPDAQMVSIASWKDLKEVLLALAVAKEQTLAQAGEVPEDHPHATQRCCTIGTGEETITFQTLVVDSFTDAQVLMLGAMTGHDTGTSLELDLDHSIPFEKWDNLYSVMETILRDQRSWPCHTVFICLAEATTDDKQVRYLSPMFKGKKIQARIGQFFNAVGLVRYDNSGRFAVNWKGQQGFSAKPAPGWPRSTPFIMSETGKPDDASVFLGSLALKTYAKNADLVPCREDDDADKVVSGPETTTTTTTTATTDTATARKRGRR